MEKTITEIRRESLEERKRKLEEDKFWIAVEELTNLLKENHKPLVNLIKNNNFQLYNRKENKDVKILELSLINLNYELKDISPPKAKAMGIRNGRTI